MWVLWLKLREVLRAVSLNLLLIDQSDPDLRESRADLISTIYGHFEETFENASSSGDL